MVTNAYDFDLEVREINDNYVPTYTPIISLLTNREQEQGLTGKVQYNFSETKGTIKATIATAQDTEKKQGFIGKSNFNYNKYVKTLQLRESGLQVGSQANNVANSVLDELLKQFDGEAFLGDAPSMASADIAKIQNDAVFFSTSPKYSLKSDVTVNDTTLDTIYNILESAKRESEANSGNANDKVFVLYGDAKTRYNKFVPSLNLTYKQALQQALGYRIEDLPEAIEATFQPQSKVSGFLLLSPMQIKFRYTQLPSLKKMGYQDEKDYTWYNYDEGSTAAELKAKSAIIKQPLIFG
jgi:hypothetical protein